MKQLLMAIVATVIVGAAWTATPRAEQGQPSQEPSATDKVRDHRAGRST